MPAAHIYSPLGRPKPTPTPTLTVSEPPAPTLKELEELALAAHAEAIIAMEKAPHSSLLVSPEEWGPARARLAATSAAYLAAVDIWTDALVAARK